jgi:hypothetical protein
MMPFVARVKERVRHILGDSLEAVLSIVQFSCQSSTPIISITNPAQEYFSRPIRTITVPSARFSGGRLAPWTLPQQAGPYRQVKGDDRSPVLRLDLPDRDAAVGFRFESKAVTPQQRHSHQRTLDGLMY